MFNELFEATTSQLQRKQKSITRLFPTFPDRVKAVADNGGIRLEAVEDELWKFKIHSGTKKDVWYDAYFLFKDIIPTLIKVIKDRRLWIADKSRIDKKKLARKFMDVVDIQIKCSCPAFQYWGPAYILSLGKYDAKYTSRELRPPKIRNPKQYGGYCKHLANLMRALPFYVDTMMKWMEDFYSEDIEQFEEETRKEYGWAKAAAKELGKKKEEVGTEKEKTEESIKEVVAELSAVEQKLRGFYRNKINKPLTLSTWSGEQKWYKFWMFPNGDTLPVEESHNETAYAAGILYADRENILREEGLISGHFDSGNKELVLHGKEKPNEEQTESLRKLSLKYGTKSLWAIFGDKFNPIEVPNVKSPEHLEYLLTYGKEEAWESIEEAVSTLSAEQKVIKNHYKEKSKELKPVEWEGGKGLSLLKFWLLNDGTIIPVENLHELTLEEIFGEDFKYMDMIESGAVRGNINPTKLILSLHWEGSVSKSQKSKILGMYLKYKLNYLIVDNYKNVWWKSSIKSPEHLEYLLTYGKEEAWESKEVYKGKIMNPFDDILERCLSEKKVEDLVEDFLYKWQEEGSLPDSFLDAITEYWKKWEPSWLRGKLTFLKHLKDRIPDHADEIEELEEEVPKYSKHPERYA